MISRGRAFLSTSFGAIREVAGNPGLRRVETAWAVWVACNGALAVALLVFAFQRGGGLGVALLGAVQMLPSVVLVPVITGLGDRWRRQRVLAVIYVAAAIAATGLAFVFTADIGVIAVYLLASLVATVGALIRPVQASLLPALARSPGELIASNVVSGSAEGLGGLLGPSIGAALLIAGGPALVALVAAVGLFGAGMIVAGVHVIASVQPLAVAARQDLGSLRAGATEGFRAAAHLPAPRLILLTLGAQTFVRGMLSVLLVVLAISTAGLGEPGIGMLNASIGAGGLIGGIFAIGLVGRSRLGTGFGLGLIGWGLPIMVIGLVQSPLVAVAALIVLGLSNAILDVSGFTLLQGTVPDRVRVGVFGVLEALIGLSVATGGVVASVLVDRLGLPGALLVTGAILPVLAVALWRRIARLEDHLVVPARQLEILRAVPMFAPMSLAVLEQMAAGLSDVDVPAATELIREGAPGDSFYVITHGTVEVLEGGRHMRDLGPGDSFGEIALIRGIPRTATVRATSEVRAYRLACWAFLSAVTGNPYSASAADAEIARFAR